MNEQVKLSDLEGFYDVRYSSSPRPAGYFQPGFGKVGIRGNEFAGVDARGVIWAGKVKLLDDRTLNFKTTIYPSESQPHSSIIDENGNMTNEPQSYEADAKITKLDDELIIRVAFKHGINTINAQFRKNDGSK